MKKVAFKMLKINFLDSGLVLNYKCKVFKSTCKTKDAPNAVFPNNIHCIPVLPYCFYGWGGNGYGF